MSEKGMINRPLEVPKPTSIINYITTVKVVNKNIFLSLVENYMQECKSWKELNSYEDIVDYPNIITDLLDYLSYTSENTNYSVVEDILMRMTAHGMSEIRPTDPDDSNNGEGAEEMGE